VVVIGSSVMDIVGRPEAPLVERSSTPGQVRMSPGGVARNVAENLARLGVEVSLITAVGDDPPGRQLLEQAEQAGVDVRHALRVPGSRTGTYLALLTPQGGLHLALDDMGVVQALTPEYLEARRAVLEGARAIVLDANVTVKTLAAVIDRARKAHVPVAADPTTVGLAANLRPHLRDLWLVTPNEAEAEVLCPHPSLQLDGEPVPDNLTAIPSGTPKAMKHRRAVDAARHLVAEGVEIALVTMAEFGVGYATAATSGHVPAVQTEVLDPTGAGDAQTAAVVFGLLNGIPLDESVRLGISAAALTLRTAGSVVADLSLERLDDELR
jgi:pseudouridine kinase